MSLIVCLHLSQWAKRHRKRREKNKRKGEGRRERLKRKGEERRERHLKRGEQQVQKKPRAKREEANTCQRGFLPSPVSL